MVENLPAVHPLRSFSTARVINYTYERAASLKPSGRDAANRLGYFYVNGVLTDLTWDANPLRCAPGTVVATCWRKAAACILGTRLTG